MKNVIQLMPVPTSLLELVRQFEDAIDKEMTESTRYVTETAASKTVHDLNAFIESAWNGSMCI
jgi:hypothetical protein